MNPRTPVRAQTPEPADGPAADPGPPPAPSARGLGLLASIDLNLLVPLMALLEERSVTRAAERVSLSQPAMSHALRRLRHLLGDELLIRDGGGMRLTPRAQGLVAPVRQALTESARALVPSTFDPGTDRRTITIALTTSTALVLAPLLRAKLETDAPGMTLRLRTGPIDAPTVFTDGGVDLALVTEGLASPAARERLYDDHWVVLTSADIPRGRGVVDVLRKEPHIRFESERMQLHPYDILDREGIAYTVQQTVNDYLLVPLLLARNRGVGLHRFQVATELAGLAPLRLFDFPFPIAPLGIDMVWNPWLTDEPYRAWLRELLLSAAAPLRERVSTEDHSPHS